MSTRSIAFRCDRSRWEVALEPSVVFMACQMARSDLFVKGFKELINGLGGGHKHKDIRRLTSIEADAQWRSIQVPDLEASKAPRSIMDVATKDLADCSNSDVEAIRKWARRTGCVNVLWAVGDKNNADQGIVMRSLENEHGYPCASMVANVRKTMLNLPALPRDVSNTLVEAVRQSLPTTLSDDELVLLSCLCEALLHTTPETFSRTVLRYAVNDVIRKDLGICREDHGGAEQLLNEMDDVASFVKGADAPLLPESYAVAFFAEMSLVSPTWVTKKEHLSVTYKDRDYDQDVAYTLHGIPLANKRM